MAEEGKVEGLIRIGQEVAKVAFPGVGVLDGFVDNLGVLVGKPNMAEIERQAMRDDLDFVMRGLLHVRSKLSERSIPTRCTTSACRSSRQ